MVDRHPLYIGWFKLDGEFAKTKLIHDSRLAIPKVRRELTPEDIQSIGREHHIALSDHLTDHGYLCVELTTSKAVERDAIRSFVNLTSCDVLDKNFRVSSVCEQIGDSAE